MAMRDLVPWSRQSSTAPVHYRGDDSPLMSFRREVDRLFDDMFGGWPSVGSGMGRGSVAWPNVELSENERELRITAEMPGMTDKDVELLLENGMLTLRGEKKSESEDKDRGYSERFYGRFERRIQLPSNVDESGAKADFREGLLTVTLPKSAEAERGRRIPINGGTRH
ncbi:MAG: Hsp20/alpha crystallin family protein [Allosphingosinicella sp.]|uniref:Hsp20/alpha crystallin family protein n=1 Tax=Allosphingosinicella sp. TaxID=2823234 RepID=UPI0039618EAF